MRVQRLRLAAPGLRPRVLLAAHHGLEKQPVSRGGELTGERPRETATQQSEKGAAEHDEGAPAQDEGAEAHECQLQSRVLLTVEDLQALRTSPHGNHKEARALLQNIAKEPEAKPIDLTVIWKDWKAYIAKHRQRQKM